MPEQTTEHKPLSVSEAMARAKGALESCTLTLIGEVSEVSNKPGYKAVYFTVKDEGASLPAMMWMNRFQASGVELTVGALVQLTGRFTLYAPKGRMNFDVFSLSLAGEGDLRQRVAQLAKKLQSEGLMDAARKRILPAYPETIGLVTSPRGAAVHDVLRTLRKRYPCARVLLAGVPVEGALAPRSLAEGLTCVAQAGAEVVLLVRGGGSFEDLMPFNDEMLARTIAGLSVPVVTGIGHEPDTSIADMVADVRASTPTAAAQVATPDFAETRHGIRAYQQRMSQVLQGRLERSLDALAHFVTRPALSDPRQLIAVPAQTLDIEAERLVRAIPASLERDHALLEGYGRQIHHRAQNLLDPYARSVAGRAHRLEDLSPLAVLGRGYSLTRNSEGGLVKSIDSLHSGDRLTIAVSDGIINATVDETEKTDYEILS